MDEDDCRKDIAVKRVMQQSERDGIVLNSLLKMAVVAGVETAVALHISRGDDLNARDSDGRTPLMLCALKSQPRICELLLAAGANPDLISPLGQTAYEIAIERGANEVAGLLTPSPPEGVDNSASHTEKPTYLDSSVEAAIHIVESATAAELDDWEPDDVQEPPAANSEVAFQASQVQHEISHHAPLDCSTVWDDVDAYLPELAHVPTGLRADDDIRSTIRLLLLRGMREGSVPDMAIQDIAEVLDPEDEHDIAPHLRRILGDIGVETDDRFEYVCPYENFKVHVDQDASELEEDTLSNAFMRLESIVARSNEPIRQYLRSIQSHALLSAEEERQLGQAMDSCLQQALNLIATDDTAVRYVLDGMQLVQIGSLRLSTISRGGNATREAATDEEQSTPIDGPSEQSAEPGTEQSDDVNELDGNEGVQLDSIVQSLEQHLSTAESRLTEGELSDIFCSLRLSASFLSKLANECEGWQRTTTKLALSTAMQRYRVAHDRMTTSNLKLVFFTAKKYGHSGLPLEDLVQEGNLGLIKAVERYDWRKGFKFSTFAIWWIRQQIGRYVADTARTVRLPVYVHEKVQSLRWMIRKYEAAHGEVPSLEAMAEAINMRVDKVGPLLTYMEDITTIDRVELDSLADPDFIERFYLEDPEVVAIAKEEATKAIQLLGVLSRKQRDVLCMRFGIGVPDALSLEEVGHCMGVTRERIRQIESKALKVLQHPTRIAWLNGISDVHPQSTSLSKAAESEENKKYVRSESLEKQLVEDAPLQPAPALEVEVEQEQKVLPLTQALLLAKEMGLSVEDLRSEGAGRLWVRITSIESVEVYRLVKQLRTLGFQEDAGQGYWI